jgi:hypothetical protein
MNRLRTPLRIVRAGIRPYLALTALLYGVCLVGFGLALVFPELTADRVTELEEGGTADLVIALMSNVWLFALVTLAMNLLHFGGLSIVLPSMIVPFAGIAIAAYRAFIIGTTLTPTDEAGWVILIPHTLTWILEFQAYVLLSLGAYLLGRAWLRPASVGAPNRRQAYLHGLRQLGWLSLPASVLLVVGAVYEAFSLVYLIGPLQNLLLG